MHKPGAGGGGQGRAATSSAPPGPRVGVWGGVCLDTETEGDGPRVARTTEGEAETDSIGAPVLTPPLFVPSSRSQRRRLPSARVHCCVCYTRTQFSGEGVSKRSLSYFRKNGSLFLKLGYSAGTESRVSPEWFSDGACAPPEHLPRAGMRVGVTGEAREGVEAAGRGQAGAVAPALILTA